MPTFTNPLIAPAAQQNDPAEGDAARRARLWDLGPSLHCSIVGTCLTTGELRALVRKFGTTHQGTLTDHDLHAIAVSASGRRDLLAKQIQKALDQRHKQAISRFSAARDEEALRRLWRDAMEEGDIPGAYWALLTHPSTTDALVKRAFGDVHMLSHLVGAANRADIRHLHRLEEDKAALEEKLARQQQALHDGITSRDARIRELNELLSTQIEKRPVATIDDNRSSALERLVIDLRKQIDLEARLRARAEQRATALTEALAASDRVRQSAERERDALRAELDVVEAQLAPPPQEDGTTGRVDWNLAGRTILYVGGRTHQIARLRAVVEGAAGLLIHHDGGIEERADLLPGLVSRADIAVFPVDCISHAATQSLKRLCRQYGRPFVPLRSSGINSLLHALRLYAA